MWVHTINRGSRTYRNLNSPFYRRSWEIGSLPNLKCANGSFDSQFGQYSRIYRLTRDDSPSIVTLSVDFPFYDQHELTVCYRNIGWQLIDRNAVFVDAEQLAEQAIIRARFESAEGHGLLLFGHLDGKGELLAPRYVMDSGSTFHRLFARFRQQEGTFISRGVTQVQAWVTGPIEVREEIEAEIREIFVEFRERGFSVPRRGSFMKMVPEMFPDIPRVKNR